MTYLIDILRERMVGTNGFEPTVILVKSISYIGMGVGGGWVSKKL